MTNTPHDFHRVKRCEDALRLYNDDWDAETNLIDFLADARHWCDQHALSYAQLDRLAHSHYLAEVNDSKGGRA